MSIDWTKPVRLTDGRKLRVICTDAGPNWPIVLLIERGKRQQPITIHANQAGEVCEWPKGGRCIENVPAERFVWINVYPDTVGAHYATRDDADYHANVGRTHVLQINLDTGECIKHDCGTLTIKIPFGGLDAINAVERLRRGTSWPRW